MNGTTIHVNEFVHEDWSRAWEVEIRRDNARCFIPTWDCKTETGARTLANAAWRAAHDTTDVFEIRQRAMEAR